MLAPRQLIQRSLDTTDRELARCRLAEEIGKVNKVEQKLAGLTLAELLMHYEERLAQYAPQNGRHPQVHSQNFQSNLENRFEPARETGQHRAAGDVARRAAGEN